jgi:hypothetical protein
MPIYVNIHITGDGGEGVARILLGEWWSMCPASRVLAIHEQLPSITKGNVFFVTKETY